MLIHKKRLGWLFYTTLIIFLVLGFVWANQKMGGNLLGKIKQSIWSEITVNLSLTGIRPVSFLKLGETIVKKSLKGEFPKAAGPIEINVRFKHLIKIKKKRDEAIKLTLLVDPKFYPATLVYKGETYPAKIRLKGDLTDHWRTPNRWSFRIKLKNGRTILGMNQFSIQKPITRVLPADHLFETWMQSVGNLAPKHAYAHIRFNGDDWGIMNIEQHKTKNLLELNQRKESPIITYGSQASWRVHRENKDIKGANGFHGFYDFSLHNEKKYALNTVQTMHYSYAINAYRDLLAHKIGADELYDIDQLSKAVIAAAIWQNFHGVDLQNARFVVNPYTTRFELITADQGELISFSETKGWLSKEPSNFIIALLQSPTFYKNFNKNLAALKETLPALKAEYKNICEVFTFDCPAFNFSLLENNMKAVEDRGPDLFVKWLAKAPPPIEPGLSNEKYFKLKPVPKGVKYASHIFAEYHDNGDLVVWNEVAFDLTLESIKLICKKNTGCKDDVLLLGPKTIRAGHDAVFTKRTHFQLPAKMALNTNRYLEITTSLDGVVRTHKVAITLASNLYNPLQDRPLVTTMKKPPEFLNIQGKTITVKPGDWNVNTSLHIPAGYKLKISHGTTLRFASDAYLLSQGPLDIEGTETAPVKLTSSQPDKTWSGIYVLRAGEKSKLQHVQIENTRSFINGVLILTGGVNFYESDVDMDRVTFGNTVAEDELNIVRSTFDIKNSVFKNTRSDAFDSDFSNGVISTSRFEKIGGDGLDTSGSSMVGKDLTFDTVVDKAISAGEASILYLKNIKANNTGSAAVSKDGSMLEISGLKAQKSKLFAAMAYIKKDVYGPASLILTDTDHKPIEVYNQQGNILQLNGKNIAGQALDVDKLYKSGPMKKER